MDAWDTRHLHDVAKVIRGVSFDKGQLVDRDFSDAFPILRAGNIQNRLLLNSDLIYLPSAAVSEEQRMRRGDVAICMSSGSSDVVGKTALLDGDWNGSVGAFCSIIRFRHGILPKFGAYWLQSAAFLSWRNSNAKGANIQNIRRAELENLILPAPPLEEQARIVGLLDEADALRKLRADASRRTADLIPALFDDMFGDPSTNPKDWPVRRCGELMESCGYGTSRKASDDHKGVPLLRMNNVTADGSLYLRDVKTVELDAGELSNQRLRKGDILFNRTNSRELVGKTGIWDGRFEAVAASYFIRVRFQKNVEAPEHFAVFMNLPYAKRLLAQLARGAVGQANINAQELRAIQLPVPPHALQKEFAARVAEIRAVEAEQARSKQRLDGLFQSMLHRAFAGEL